MSKQNASTPRNWRSPANEHRRRCGTDRAPVSPERGFPPGSWGTRRPDEICTARNRIVHTPMSFPLGPHLRDVPPSETRGRHSMPADIILFFTELGKGPCTDAAVLTAPCWCTMCRDCVPTQNMRALRCPVVDGSVNSGKLEFANFPAGRRMLRFSGSHSRMFVINITSAQAHLRILTAPHGRLGSGTTHARRAARRDSPAPR